MNEHDDFDTITILENRIKELENENSALKKQQLQINNAKELYLKIFEDFPALIWRSGLDKLCNYFNRYWLEFTGRTMEQEYGNGWTEGLHPDDFDFCVQTYLTAFDKREPFLMEYRLKNKEGNYCWIRDYGRPFFDLDNTFLGYIGSCYDITTIRNHEQQLVELNATKDKLFSIIAHDLRTPFMALINMNEIVSEKIDMHEEDSAKKLLEMIHCSSQQALDLLNNLLQWSRLQAGKIEFKPKQFYLTEIIDNLLILLKANYIAKNIEITTKLNPDLQLYADKNMIEIIMQNLLSNAIKFTHKGGCIEISASKHSDFAEIVVLDNGVGIPADKKDKLFKIESNYSSYGTERERGTGLGLILCKDFVEQHNGKIWVESEENKWSKFSFTIKQ